MENNTNQKFDVVIAGGGLSGALSALSLSQLKQSDGSALSIAIVETNPILQHPKLSFDSRVLALSHGSAAYLNLLGVWPLLVDDAAPIEDIHISDRGHYGKARIYANEHQVAALGYVIEMSLLGNALLAELAKLSNITWFCPDEISDIQWKQQQVDIKLSSRNQLTAKLLLACDGAQSGCRTFANIASTSKPYKQSALIANVSMVHPHQNVAYERFTEHGPIAMLPLNDGSQNSKKCSLVWTLPPDTAKETAALDDLTFKLTLEQAFGSWLGAVEKVGERVVYPLHLVTANEQVFHRMVLVGNASHTIHPIAGQGFNLGLRDVAELVTCINNLMKKNEDIATFSALTEYAEQRKLDHKQVIALTDSLVTLFSNQLPPLVVGRNIGLKVLNYFSPLKKAFVNKTMGY